MKVVPNDNFKFGGERVKTLKFLWSLIWIQIVCNGHQRSSKVILDTECYAGDSKLSHYID